MSNDETNTRDSARSRHNLHAAFTHDKNRRFDDGAQTHTCIHVTTTVGGLAWNQPHDRAGLELRRDTHHWHHGTFTLEG
jgi:hypothetical protein